MAQRKIIHVELKQPYQGKQHYYFGSIASIYDILPSEIVGITKESLWNALRSGTYNGKEVIIRKDHIHSKPTNRGKKPVV